MLAATLQGMSVPLAMRLRKAASAAFLLMPFMLVVFRGGAELCMILIGLLFLFSSWHERNWEWTSKGITLIAALTWLWVVLAVSPFALDPADSFRRALGWIRFPLFFIAAVYWVLPAPGMARKIALTMAGLLAFILSDTLFQYLLGYDVFGRVSETENRLTGPFSNVKVGIFISKMLFPVVGFLLWDALRNRRRKWAWAYGAMTAASLLVILLTGERTTFATAMMATGVVVALCMWAYPRWRMKLAGAGLLTVAAMGALILTQEPVRSRANMLVDHVGHFWESPYGRVAKVSLTLAERFPLHGVGMDNFERACQSLMNDEKLVDYCEMHSHNPYMEWLTETGVPGLLLFLALVGWMVRQPAALFLQGGDGRLMAIFALAVMVVHFFPLMSISSTVSNWPGMVLWYSLALAVGFSRAVEAEHFSAGP